MRTISKPRNWIKATAVRVRRINGRDVVEIRRTKKRKPAAKRKRRNPPRKKRATVTKRRRNVAGYMDSSGEFHPIRHSKGYSPEKAGDFESHYARKKRATATKRRRKSTKRKSTKRGKR